MLIPKRRGKLRSVQITPPSHQMVSQWAESHGYQLASVVETAIKEFCQRHANDPTSDEAFLAPAPLAVEPESDLCSVCAGPAPGSETDASGDRYCKACA